MSNTGFGVRQAWATVAAARSLSLDIGAERNYPGWLNAAGGALAVDCIPTVGASWFAGGGKLVPRWYWGKGVPTRGS
jgi:hypothetical protein